MRETRRQLPALRNALRIQPASFPRQFYYFNCISRGSVACANIVDRQFAELDTIIDICGIAHLHTIENEQLFIRNEAMQTSTAM